MPHNLTDPRPFFLSTLTASRRERQWAGAVLVFSLLVFVAIAPFAKTQLAPLGAFIPGYQSALVVIDLITVALLFGQFFSFHSRALFMLACGYLYTALMTIAHTGSFPGLFAPTGLFGAGPQSTAWLYMFWHGGFPLFVVAYAQIKRSETQAPPPPRHPLGQVFAALAGISALVAGCTLLATRGHDILPPIMAGNQYTPAMIVVVTSVWLLSLVALVRLWLLKPHSVLDLWLMVVMCAWLIDIALSAVLNHGRYDLGFYAGRIYGLLAASLVLLVLLVESGMLYTKLIQLATTLQRLSLQDTLTGIPNRRAFDAALEHEWHCAVRSGLPLSLMMIDIDHFKQYNDSYGHVEGDKCLRAVAKTLQAGIARSTDLVARFGGEEFAVLLPQTNIEAAGLLAERLRSAVEALAIPHQRADSGQTTISIGVACLSEPAVKRRAPGGAGGTALIETADQQLYLAKAAGRNCVVTAPHFPAAPVGRPDTPRADIPPGRAQRA